MPRTIVLFLIAAFFNVSCSTKPYVEELEKVRIEQNFNSNWGFTVDSLETGSKNNWAEHGIPDTLEQKVQLPHTWNTTNGLESYAGQAWYQKTFEASKEWKGKRVYLKFGAINRNAIIYLNGAKIAEHIGAGYTTFFVELTPHLLIGQPNKIVIVCDNKFTKQSVPYDWAFDWANDGGIYRDVTLVVTNQQAFGHVFITPTFTTQQQSHLGTLDIQVNLAANSSDRQIAVRVIISEENQTTRNRVLDSLVIFQQSGHSFKASIDIKNIKLWHFNSPNLYKVKLGLLADNKLTDNYECITGFKSFIVKNGKFYFNNEPVRLAGIEWMPGSNPELGFAEDINEINKMLTLVKESNAVMVRFHWPQDEKVIDWCNRNGLLVQEEIPHWQLPNELDESTQKSILTHATEMIERDYNAPCIFSWGIANELNGQSEEVNRLLKKTRDYIKQTLDPLRLISYTSNTLHIDPKKDAGKVGDFLMWNDYQGTWHSTNTDSVGIILDQIHTAYPDKPIVISEFGLCEPRFTGGDTRRIRDMKTHIGYYINKDFVAGAIYFSLNDYRTHFGESGTGRNRQRIHGITDLVGTKKPSYIALQELWSPLQLDNINQLENVIKVRVQCKGNLPGYQLHGYRIISATGTKETLTVVDEKTVPDLRPSERITLELKKAPYLIIKNPQGFICQQIELE